MMLRLPFLIALLLSLAFGPAQWSVACAAPASKVACAGCCSSGEMACCASADHSAPPQEPVSVPPQSVDLKMTASPVVVVAILLPPPSAEQPSFYIEQAARMPVVPRLDLTCIRLI